MRKASPLGACLIVSLLNSCSRVPAPQAKDQLATLPEGIRAVEADTARTDPIVAKDTVATVSTEVPEIEAHQWVALHHLAMRLKAPGWKDAIETLKRVGDGFTIEHLQKLKSQELSASDQELLDAALKAIEERFANENEAMSAALVLPRLERAAHADLNCDPLETKLVRWTLSTIRKQADLPAVRARLEELAQSYVPADEADTEFSSMTGRVANYATRLLGRVAGGDEAIRN
jgi:hypothetical protein